MTQAERQEQWYAILLRRALTETSNVPQAIEAADLAFQQQAEPTDAQLSLASTVAIVQPELLSAFLSHDIYNRKAQGLLNRAMEAAKKLAGAARKELAQQLEKNPDLLGSILVAFLQKYRVKLAQLLTTTQLAALLSGAQEVARHLPSIPPPGSAVPPPPTLPPDEAQQLVIRLKGLSAAEREAELYQLQPAEQRYARYAYAWEAGKPPSPPNVLPLAPAPGSPEEIHWPVIEAAAEELSSKNVMSRAAFDQLDAVARQKAFTIAGVDAQDTLVKVRNELSKNIAEGVDYATFRKKVLESVDEGTFLSEGHLETIFRTNVQTGFSDGQLKVLQHPYVRSGFPYASYEAIHDDRVRHNHLALEKYGIQGTNIYRIDDPVFQLFRPPWDYMDRCSWVPLTIRQAAEAGIEEAIKWLETGIEPSPKAFVPMPPFQPPAGFQRSLVAAPLSIQLSLQWGDFTDARLREDSDPAGRTAGGRTASPRPVSAALSNGRKLGTPQTGGALPEGVAGGSGTCEAAAGSATVSGEDPGDETGHPHQNGQQRSGHAGDAAGSRTWGRAGVSQRGQAGLGRGGRRDAADLRVDPDGRGGSRQLVGSPAEQPGDHGGGNVPPAASGVKLATDPDFEEKHPRDENNQKFVDANGENASTEKKEKPSKAISHLKPQAGALDALHDFHEKLSQTPKLAEMADLLKASTLAKDIRKQVRQQFDEALEPHLQEVKKTYGRDAALTMRQQAAEMADALALPAQEALADAKASLRYKDKDAVLEGLQNGLEALTDPDATANAFSDAFGATPYSSSFVEQLEEDLGSWPVDLWDVTEAGKLNPEKAAAKLKKYNVDLPAKDGETPGEYYERATQYLEPKRRQAATQIWKKCVQALLPTPEVALSIQLAAKSSSGGRWVTIGAKVGEDGKKHGGSPVYIENGRITKGHPNLTGRKIAKIKEPAPVKKHLQSQRAEHEAYHRAKLRKEARKMGYPQGQLDSLAEDVRINTNEYSKEANHALKESLRLFRHFGNGDESLASLRQVIEEGDENSIKGFDVVSRSLASSFPALFAGSQESSEEEAGSEAVSAAEKLKELLLHGQYSAMTKEDAYNQAFEVMTQSPPPEKKAKSKQLEDAPFSH